jgi:hypothetical protein
MGNVICTMNGNLMNTYLCLVRFLLSLILDVGNFSVFQFQFIELGKKKKRFTEKVQSIMVIGELRVWMGELLRLYDG